MPTSGEGAQQSPGNYRAPPPQTTGQQLRRSQNTVEYGSRYATSSHGAQMRPVADPNAVLSAYHMGMQDTGRVVIGTIMDGTPVANAYRVHIEKGFAPVIATACTHTSGVCIGATEVNTYAPGTSVLVVVHDKAAVGFIIGAIPNALDVGKRAHHDYITQASRKRVDELHKKHIKQRYGGGIPNFNAWRPIDSTLASEWGAIATTGAGVTVDDFMVRAAISEFCGMYAFYHDSLLRLTGVNMQVWTGGSERDAFLDNNECNDTTGYAPYPWEAVGILQPGIPAAEEYDVKTYLCPKQKPYYAHWENKNEYQQPYHRTQVFFGYLGQGGRTITQAPPPDLDKWTYKEGPEQKGDTPYESAPGNDYGELECTGGPEKEKTHQEIPSLGLHEDNVGLDGRRFIASAKGIVLAKRLLLPMPQRLKRPDDPDGDTTENYKPSSMTGGGQKHEITGDLELTAVDPQKEGHLQRAAGVLDLHGYLFNYAGFHPFFWHEKDYKTWQQRELTQVTKTQINEKLPKFQDLKKEAFLEVPEPKKWRIDHRYGEQDYYETESFISLLDDGGIVIGDGYGGEIRMTGGSVFISAPGDVWLKSGRHTQVWTGADLSLRAHDGVDISTTEESVRIKSEKNFMVLAGNSEQEGGILLETRSKIRDYDFDNCGDDVKFGGIVLRARESNIGIIGDANYIGTPADAQDGKIILDAAGGKKDIATGSKNLFNYVSTAVFQAFGDGKVDKPVEKSNYFTADTTLTCGILSTEKDVFADGYLMCKKDIFSSEGHIYTGKADPPLEPFSFVLPIDPGALSGIIDDISELVINEIPDAVAANSNANKTLYYESQKIGNEEVHKKMAFSFRTDQQYKIENLLIFEDRWQQMARVGGSATEKWEEKSVKPVGSGCSEETYPFPGKKWLLDQPAYVEQDLEIAEFAAGGFRDKDRGSNGSLAGPYKTPKYGQANKKVMDGNYLIIGKDKS